MRVEVLERSEQRVRLLIRDAPLPLVNAVRRACYTDVPVMAVDYVEVFQNNTVLYDEIIAHRLAMIPLRSEEALRKYKWPEECSGARLGDPDCYVVLELEVETGPREQRVVYSGELRSLDPDVRPVYDNIPIVVMAPGQRLHVRGYARLGYGKEHAKWMPVTVAAHKYLPRLTFDASRVSAECMRCIEDAAPTVAERMRKLGRGTIEITDDINTSGLYWCVTKRCSGSDVKLEYSDREFILTVESAGQLKPETIVLKAVEAIRRKAAQLLKEIEELEAGGATAGREGGGS